MGSTKVLCSSFSSVFSTNVEVFDLIFLPHWCKVWRPSPSPKLLNLDQDNLSKKMFFLVKSFKIEFMVSFLIEMLELPSNFLKC